MPKFIIGGKSFEFSEDALKEALDKKTDISIAEKVVIRTEEEDTAFQSNLKATERTASLEIAVKNVREKLGLNFQGKTIENLVEAVKVKTLEEAKIEPDEKLKAAQKDIETLKGTIQTLSTEKEDAFKQLKNFKTETVVNQTLISSIPENVILPKEDIAIILKNKYTFEVDDNGKSIVKSNGEILKNPTTLDPLQPKDVIGKFFEENPTYIKSGTGGAGGGDSGGGNGKLTVDAVIEKAQKDGVNVQSPEFIAQLEKDIKDGVVKV